MDGSGSSQPSGPHIIVIVTYSQVRKGYALCRTPWRLESHLETILGGLQYGIHSLSAHPYLVWKRGQPSPLDRTTPWMDIYLTENPYGGRAKGREHQTLINFDRVEGWAGLEALVSHRPLCHHSHAKIPSKRRCTVNRYTPAKPGAMMFFSYLSSVTLADSEKKLSEVNYFSTYGRKSVIY
ncbi:hypothetical protein BGY98DRAFT_159984 [Russula aff. rugulosa BPL654]|nr:hypothetical protein BGY98DRAFT_159984 [Russula aff. rugulosa BPL654]